MQMKRLKGLDDEIAIKQLKVFHRSIVSSVLLSNEVFMSCEEFAYKQLVNKIAQEQLKHDIIKHDRQLWTYNRANNALSVKFGLNITNLKAQDFKIDKFPLDIYKLYCINKIIYMEWEI